MNILKRKEPLHTIHKPIHKKYIKRCRFCLQRLVPDFEWNVWITFKAQKRRDELTRQWIESLKQNGSS